MEGALPLDHARGGIEETRRGQLVSILKTGLQCVALNASSQVRVTVDRFRPSCRCICIEAPHRSDHEDGSEVLHLSCSVEGL